MSDVTFVLLAPLGQKEVYALIFSSLDSRCWVEIFINRIWFNNLTLRSFKLLRVLQPLTRFATFAGVEAILKTIEV